MIAIDVTRIFLEILCIVYIPWYSNGQVVSSCMFRINNDIIRTSERSDAVLSITAVTVIIKGGGDSIHST